MAVLAADERLYLLGAAVLPGGLNKEVAVGHPLTAGRIEKDHRTGQAPVGIILVRLYPDKIAVCQTNRRVIFKAGILRV